MKKFILISLILLPFVEMYAQEPDEKHIKQEISNIASKIRTLKCDFVQTKQLKMLNDKMVSHGQMYYKQGNQLRWEYTSPYKYTFILNNSQVAIKKDNRNDVIDVNQSAIFKEIVRIMGNCITGKCLTDERDFKVAISSTSTEWVATMTPQRKELQKFFKSIILHFDRQRSIVSSIELTENNGDKTLIELKNIQVNSSIDAKIFDVN